ncbi:MAG: glycosyltransferase family 2 protein [Parcubacteria group bacterium]|nr:glycosyltransferase family 2 protein [Parcubacteria group bacterium]
MDDPFVSIIIPAYNEEGRIAKTLARVKEYLDSQSYSCEILVVIDGARDSTAAIAKEAAQEWSQLRVLENKENHGKGFVVRQGMLEAKGEYRVFSDADNSTDIAHLEKMLAKFKEGFDVVIGSRDGKDIAGATQAVPQSGFKRLLGDMGNLVIQAVVLPGIWDTQAGFKGFSADAAQKIFSRAVVDRWGFDVETLALARRFNYKIGIIPIYWRNDPSSHVKLSGYIGALLETFRVRWNLWIGKYE